MIEIKVENIVASTTFADKLDLDAIAHSLEDAEYEPEQFPGLVYRLKNPKTATLLFRSGKANCTGAKNLEDVRKTIDIIADKLKKMGVDVYKKKDLERIKEPKVAMLLFGSGKIVCTGGRKTEDVSIAIEKLSEELNSLGLLR
jgi:transcription initiation factor TFIID TATA-box-binding protein